MTNILMIVSDFPPLNSIASRRTYAWAKYLSRLGHNVFVLTPKKCYFKEEMSFDVDTSPIGVFENEYLNLRKFIQSTFNIKKFSDYEERTDKKSFLNIFLKPLMNFFTERGVFLATWRIPNFLDLWVPSGIKKAEGIIKKYDIDVIITSYSPPASHIIGHFLKKKFSKLFWISDYRDLWIQNPWRKGIFLFCWIERFMEHKCIKRADLIVTASEVFKNSFIERYGKRDIEVIENGYDEELFSSFLAKSRRPHDKKRIVFAGTIYKKTRHPALLFKAVSNILTINPKALNNLEVVFFGDYHTLFALEELFEKYALNDIIKYGGFKSAQEIAREVVGADALLILERDDKFDGILPGKIFEYMYAKKPILCIGMDRGSCVGEFLNRTGLCFFCGNDTERIKDFLLRFQEGEIVTNPNEECIAQFSRKKQAKKLSDIITTHLQKRRFECQV